MTTTITGRALTAVLALATLAGFAGCNQTRPLSVVRESGDRHFERAQWEDAATEYGEIITRQPGDWHARYRFGVASLQNDDLPAARRALEIANDQRPQSAEAADALAEAYFRSGDEDELFAFLRSRAEKRQTVADHLRFADYARRLGDPDSARTALETAIRIDGGTSVEPYLAASSFNESVGDIDAAITRLRQAYSIDPYDDRIHERLRALGEIPGPTIALPPDRTP